MLRNKLKLLVVFLLVISLSSCLFVSQDVFDDVSLNENIKNPIQENSGNFNDYYSYDLSNIPDYSDKPFVVINNNIPNFSAAELTTKAFEKYASLDTLGRCGPAIACCGKELMPVANRGDISSVKPTGWVQAYYSFVDGEYLYNRCHLIGWQLTGEDANAKNLITGTRYLNVDGMLPFENMIADYIKETGNHVMYRVMPIFEGDNLVCNGVQMEAFSVEDDGEGICFNVYCYNVQPNVEIDYSTGESKYVKQTETDEEEGTYILNTNSKKVHLPSCGSVSSISDRNKKEYTGFLSDLLNDGYSACGSCLK